MKKKNLRWVTFGVQYSYLSPNPYPMKTSTMTQDARISSRIDADLKEQGDAVMAELGVKPSQVISMLYRQMVRTRKLPFEASLDPNDPLTDMSVYLGIAQGCYGSGEEIDAHIRNDRDAWDS